MNWSRIHIALFLFWALAAASLGLSIAAQGAERARLERNRGADRKARLELDHERERLRLLVEEAGHRAHITAAVRRLNLPIEAPMRFVRGSTVDDMREDGAR